jgi:hypothetical protein
MAGLIVTVGQVSHQVVSDQQHPGGAHARSTARRHARRTQNADRRRVGGAVTVSRLQPAGRLI